MDQQKLSSSEKRQKEVVLLIPPVDESPTPARAARMATTAAASSASTNGNYPNDEPSYILPPANSARVNPEIMANFSSSHQPEKSILRHRSVSKPKSRFIEQPPPSTDSTPAETTASLPRHGSLSQKYCCSMPGNNQEDLEEEEEEIYKKQPIAEMSRSSRQQRKLKVLTLAECAVLSLATACLAASLTITRLERLTFWGLHLWIWCLMVTVIFCGHLFTRWFITFLVFCIERNFLFKKKVLYFVYGLKDSVRVCLWSGLVLLTWSLLFRRDIRLSRSSTMYLGYISRGLASLLIGSVLWLVKTLLVKLLASSFHMNKFFDRIQESIFHQYLLQTLSGAPLMELAENIGKHSGSSTAVLSFRSMKKGKGKGGEQQEVIDIAKLCRMRQEKVSAWTMKGLINVIGTSGLSTISSSIECFDEDGDNQRDTEITSEWEAKAAAFRIFKNVAKPGLKYIDVEDLLRFLNEEEVDFVLPLFEGAADTRKIKKSALRNWVVKVYVDRKSLVHSLNDSDTAIRQLHKLASVIVVVVILIVTLLLMGVATTKLLVLISSQLLLVGFMFGNTCKTVFEAIIFVFVMHPFDAGDRCVVDGVQMVVEEMNILTTTFLKNNNEKIYYPNTVLATKPISNFYRSPEMGDTIHFSVDLSTPMESIGSLKSKIQAYIDSKPHHWQPNHSIVVNEIVDVNKLNMTLFVKHTMNFQNILEKNSRRSDLVLELKKIFEELLIRYHLLPQEIQFSYSSSNPLPVSLLHQRF